MDGSLVGVFAVWREFEVTVGHEPVPECDPQRLWSRRAGRGLGNEPVKGFEQVGLQSHPNQGAFSSGRRASAFLC